MIERRQAHGSAEFAGARLEAIDSVDEELVPAAERLALSARAALLENMTGLTSARFVVSVRRAGHSRRDEVLFELTRGGHSLVTTPAHLSVDALLLRELPTEDLEGVPHALPHAFVWRNGSAAVLLHEAIGHAAECGAPAIKWPEWLRVRDVPPFPIDDCGDATAQADLTMGEPPQTMRRETFRDAPLPRMSGVRVECEAAQFTAAEQRVEVHLVGGGTYDSVRDEIALRISAASIVEGPRRRPLRPFVFTAQRAEVVQAMRGAMGFPVRYPGVICSREGQDVYVESAAPDVLTVFA